MRSKPRNNVFSRSKEIQLAMEQKKAAEELNRAQNRFFSSMSHELRTPINTILGLNEVILRNEELPDEVIEDSKKIRGAGKMLLSIINDILDMSKIESGKMDLVPVDYSVSDFVSEIVNMTWSAANEKGLKFVMDVDPDIPSVLRGDEVRIKQIMVNLLSNAIKYTQSGEIRLHIESERVSESEVIVSMVVSDTGIGIKKEAIPFLFDAFKRADEERNRNIEGTGLGLSIVKQLVDMMNGEITVDSLYTRGSTFTVRLVQQIVSAEATGEIDISGHVSHSDRPHYTQSFEAPGASVLFVDDNELNIEVESKLIKETKVFADKALSGAEALAKTRKRHYDLIFMDHMMPEMDGIECLQLLRNQADGANRDTPVVVLTANAGAENKKLYRNSGFDGYLVKPVSGYTLEETLLSFLPDEKIHRLSGSDITSDTTISRFYQRRIPIAVATSSIADLPGYVTERLGISTIPFVIHTEGGTFDDNREMVSDELIHYMADRGKHAKSEPPSVEDYERFFADELTNANHLIFIALAKGSGREYERACLAAQAFNNVTVIDSGNLSTACGIVTLAAYRYSKKYDEVDEVVRHIEAFKERVKCSFVMDTTKFMLWMGNISNTVHMIANTLMLHPSVRMKNSAISVRDIWAGSKMDAWRGYIKKTIKRNKNYDPDILFITYVGMNADELAWVESEVNRRASFKKIVYKRASAAISLNVGPGAFGLLFMEKDEDNPEIGSLIKRSYIENDVETTVMTNLDIDEESGIKNCGSKNAFLAALKMFASDHEKKRDEIQKYYEDENIESYTIKVHALKSSSKIIGVSNLSEMSYRLEVAGKNNDMVYIKRNHERLISEFNRIVDVINERYPGLFVKEESSSKPVAGKYIIDGAVAAILDAAKRYDLDSLELAIDELNDYTIPEEYRDSFNKIKSMTEDFDYDGIVSLLENKTK